MVRAWIATPGKNHLDLHFFGAGHGGIEIVDLKPQQDAVSMRQTFVANWTMIVFRIPQVQLQDQLPVRKKTRIPVAAILTLAIKQTLIPATARFHITHTN